MFVSRLALDHYRSWEHCVVDLADGVNILHGANGMGKTNIVEAIEVLSTGSSHRASSSLPLVERGRSSATIRANVQARSAANVTPTLIDDSSTLPTGIVGESTGASAIVTGRSPADAPAAGRHVPAGEGAAHAGTTAEAGHGTAGDAAPAGVATTYELTVAARGANRARINGGASRYMRDVVGAVPSVSFTPEDQRLVSGDPATRRTFLNQAATLLVPGYAARLQMIAKIARQRAALLKQLADRTSPPSAADAALSGLEVWTGQFIETGVALTYDRQRIVDALAGPFARIYRDLAGADQIASLRYEPSFAEVGDYDDPRPAISGHFQRIYPGEVARGANLIGPHRDDLALTLDGAPAREFASNGEMWTLALAMKMALYETVAAQRGEKPIVILDDVFAQLDESRRAQILAFAGRQDQVIITVAAASDIPELSGARHATVIDVAALKRAQDEYLHPDLDALMAGVADQRPAAAADTDTVGERLRAGAASAIPAPGAAAEAEAA